MFARGRDLLTSADGGTTVLGNAALELTIAYTSQRGIVAISCDPPVDALEQLVGVRASTGFRQAVDDALPGERQSGSLRFQLLDDVPTAALVSGYALGAGGVHAPRSELALQQADLCAGWATGATILTDIEINGRPPVVTGPEAPSIETPEDAWGWHEVALLPAHGMRRRRRLDVWRENDGDHELGRVDGFFRDSHMDANGCETVVHEYGISASIDLETMQFNACDASVGALPWVECPVAAASAGRLVGAPADGLRTWVRNTFLGPTTCTHLNDTLRSLEDVPALLASL